MKGIKLLLFIGIVVVLLSVQPTMMNSKTPENPNREKLYQGNLVQEHFAKEFPEKVSRVMSNEITVSESGYYYFQLCWYYAASYTDIYLDEPYDMYIGQYYGYHPSPGNRISLGYFNTNDEIVIKIETNWHNTDYGPEYSTDTDFFKIDNLSENGWCFTFEDAADVDSGYNDGRFIIDKSGDW
jgi:hypothetical protein